MTLNIIITIYCIMILWVLYRHKGGGVEIKIPEWFLLIPLLLFVFARALPFFLYGSDPLGYDTGFYNHSINQARSEIGSGSLSISRILNPAGSQSLGQLILTNVLILVGFDNWIILYGIYILMGAVSGYLIFLIAKKRFGDLTAWSALYLYSTSLTQYLFFSEMLWRNAIGLTLMLFIFYILESKRDKLIWLIPPVFLFLAATHRTSAVVFFGVISFYIFLERKIRPAQKLIVLFSTIAGVLVLYSLNQKVFISLVAGLFSNSGAESDIFALREGLFINPLNYPAYSFFYLPFAIFGATEIIRKKDWANPFFLLGIISLMFVVLRLFFYKRMLIFLDISLLFLAACGLAAFFRVLATRMGSLQASAFFLVLLSLPVLGIFYHVIKTEPLMPSRELENIRSMELAYPGFKILTYDSANTPWIYGFSGHKTIAPGWGDTGWNLEDWEYFWNGEEVQKTQKLKEAVAEFGPFILYDRVGAYPSKDKCFKAINKSHYKFTCK